MENTAQRVDEPLHNVIVTSIPSEPNQGRTMPTKNQSEKTAVSKPNSSQPLFEAMTVPFTPQQQHHYPIGGHHAQPQQIIPAPAMPFQRGPNPNNAQNNFNMGNLNQTLPIPSYHPSAHSSQAPPATPLPQMIPPPQPPPKPIFNTGPSPAAVAFQLSQQMQLHYQGSASTGSDNGSFFTQSTFQHSPQFYDPYNIQQQHHIHQQQSYIPYPQDHPSGIISAPYSSSYPPSYSHTTGNIPTPGQGWYAHPPQQSVSFYYNTQVLPYTSNTTQPQLVPTTPQIHTYRDTPEQARRHSVPVRAHRGPDVEAIGHAVTYYPSQSNMRNVRVTPSTGTNFENIQASRLSSTTPSSIPRGPPRKPKQSGNALWVGNLPPHPTTDVAALKDYFSTDAREDIESVFLISKSNCAFVNYRTEVACDAAMRRFHNSKFRGTRLVCRPRPRKESIDNMPGSSQISGPDDVFAQASVEGGGITREDGDSEIQKPIPKPEGKTPPTGPASVKTPRTNAKHRYFILKSLTVKDLEMSVKNGVWATQSHNEAVLNQAFEAAESVFLIFSANKSGEYYGYARMASRITNDLSSTIGWMPTGQSDLDSDLPKATYTAATETAPKGRIVDDSGRGTIFWEALSDSEVESDNDNDEADEKSNSKAISQAWGASKPFKVEWLSTTRIPFYRTRGLRNNLNSGREVKVARDGTELEEVAGRRLLQMF